MSLKQRGLEGEMGAITAQTSAVLAHGISGYIYIPTDTNTILTIHVCLVLESRASMVLVSVGILLVCSMSYCKEWYPDTDTILYK